MTIIVLIAVLLLVVFAALGWWSAHGAVPTSTFSGEHLSACGEAPNCVCSEFPADSDHYVEALKLNTEHTATVMANVETALSKMNISIVQQTPDYLAATYRSAVFGFVDDIEIRLDREQGLLHLRSASRVGKSDLGANLKRINALKKALVE